MSGANEKYILAIDLGTSGSKTALATPRGEIVDFEFEKVPLYLFANGGAEQDPADWWAAILSTSKRLLGKGTVRPEDVVAICCSAQWSGTVAVDKDGNHLMNAVIWMDSRGVDWIDQVRRGWINVEGYGLRKAIAWVRKSGAAPAASGKDPAGHILFIRNVHPEVYRETYKFLEPKDYINMRLTGRFAASYDSITLHWVTDNRDISRIAYDDELIGFLGIERQKLPDLLRSVDLLGTVKKEVAAELGLREDVKVVTGSPDVTTAAVGSGAVRDYEGHSYIGTSSWISAHVPFKKTNVLHNFGCVPSAIPGRYLVANEQEVAGGILNWLRDNIVFPDDECSAGKGAPGDFRVFDEIAARVPAGSNRVICTPWLYGERTPVEDDRLRGGFYNLSLTTTRSDLIRAAFEGVALNQKWVFHHVERFIKRRMDPVNLIGGGAASDIWCQIHADVLDRSVRKVKDPIQANARGSAFIASVALGMIRFEDIPDLIRIEKVFHPNPENRGIYDELFREFLNIYKNNKAMFARLNRHEAVPSGPEGG